MGQPIRGPPCYVHTRMTDLLCLVIISVKHAFIKEDSKCDIGFVVWVTYLEGCLIELNKFSFLVRILEALGVILFCSYSPLSPIYIDSSLKLA